MAKYVIVAHAKWREGQEHPHGGGRDTNVTKEKSFMLRFDAVNAKDARIKAKDHLKSFEDSLPRLHKGLSWVTDRKLTISFGRALPL